MPFFSLPTGGSPVLAGSGAPTGALGNIGDLFIDTANKLLYGPKAVGGWPSGPVDLSNGPTGPASMVTGPTGAASTITGPTGNFPFAATGPTGPSLTLAGSVWLDDTTGKYFVRYDGNWIEIGVQGERGPTGVNGGFSDAQSINAQAANYTLALSDAGKLVTMNASTGTLTVTIPPSSSAAFATGTHVDVARLGAAAVRITGASGVSVNATPGNNLRAQFSAATVVLYAGNTWLVVGDTAV